MGYKVLHELTTSPPLTAEDFVRVLDPAMAQAYERAADGEAEDEFEDVPWDWEDYFSELEMGYVLQPPEDGVCASREIGKWNDDGDIPKLSKAFPEVRFSLYMGDGDDWTSAVYWLNGVFEYVHVGELPASTLWPARDDLPLDWYHDTGA